MVDETNNTEYLEAHSSERTECEIWTRVMGYHRPVSQFNTGKKQEFKDRLCFREDKCNVMVE